MARRRKTPMIVDIQCETAHGFREFKRLAVGGVDPVSMYGQAAGEQGWWLPDAPERMSDRFHQLLRATGCHAVKLQENAARPSWLMPAVIGGALLAGLVLFAGGSKAAGSATKKACPVDIKKFEAWLIEKGLAGECAPDVSNPPYTYVDLQKSGLAPAEFSPYVLVLGDGSFWYYANVNEPVAKSENLKNQYAQYLSTLNGHPTEMFLMVM